MLQEFRRTIPLQARLLVRSKKTYEEKNGNGKKVAANDNSETKSVERYQIGSTDTVNRGFLKEFCDFTRKKGTVNAEFERLDFVHRSRKALQPAIDGDNIEVNGSPIRQQHAFAPFSVIGLQITMAGFAVVDPQPSFAFHRQN